MCDGINTQCSQVNGGYGGAPSSYPEEVSRSAESATTYGDSFVSYGGSQRSDMFKEAAPVINAFLFASMSIMPLFSISLFQGCNNSASGSGTPPPSYPERETAPPPPADLPPDGSRREHVDVPAPTQGIPTAPEKPDQDPIPEIDIPPRATWIREDGKPRLLIPDGGAVVQGIGFNGGTILEFDDDGKLKHASLKGETIIHGKRYRDGDGVNFGKDGRVTGAYSVPADLFERVTP